MRTDRSRRAFLLGVAVVALTSTGVACAARGASNDAREVAASATSIAAGSGSFLFSGSPGSSAHPIRVWYHIPEHLTQDARVLITMHGSGGTARPGRSNRDTWAPLADKHGFVVFAPEFSWAEYPGYTHYHWGNMHDDAGNPVDESLWAYTTIAHLFDEIGRRFRITTPTYTMYGHSAGAQFVHRMMIFRPDPRVDVYVSANPGSYTMASLDWKYPYGLDKGNPELNRATEQLLREALQQPFLLLVGTADTATALSTNNMRPEAMAQGRNRLERGHFFFDNAREEAAQRNVPFRWEMRLVPNVSHSNTGMAEGAVRALAW